MLRQTDTPLHNTQGILPSSKKLAIYPCGTDRRGSLSRSVLQFGPKSISPVSVCHSVRAFAHRARGHLPMRERAVPLPKMAKMLRKPATLSWSVPPSSSHRSVEHQKEEEEDGNGTPVPKPQIRSYTSTHMLNLAYLFSFFSPLHAAKKKGTRGKTSRPAKGLAAPVNHAGGESPAKSV